MILFTTWLTRTPRSRALRTPNSREPESPSVAASSTLSSRSPTSWSATPRPRVSRSPDPSGSPTSTSASAAGDHLAVRAPRPGTTGRWPSTRDTSISSAPLDRWRKSPPSPSPMELKSASISGLLLDVIDYTWTLILSWKSYNREKNGKRMSRDYWVMNLDG